MDLKEKNVQSVVEIKITLDVKPMSLKRHRHTRFGHTYNPQKKEMWEFYDMSLPFAPKVPFEKQIRLIANFYFKRPNNHFRSGKYAELLKPTAPKYHTQTPDLDNLFKFVGDSLGLSQTFFLDDRQIDKIEGGKHWAKWDYISVIMTDEICQHLAKIYQPYEPENNVPESLTCEDCGSDLTLNEPDWDIWRKDARF